MGKVGFGVLAHPDYVADGYAEELAKEAEAALNAENIDVFWDKSIALDIPSARSIGKRLAHEDLDGVVLFLGSWMECSVAMAVFREIEHLPICLWGFPMWEDESGEKGTGSYVSYAMFKGVLDRLGWPYRGVIGMPKEKEAVHSVTVFCRAAEAYQNLKRCRIGLVGYTAMNIYTGTFDHVLMRAKIGPDIEQIDSYSLIRIAEQASSGEREKVVRHLKDLAQIDGSVSNESLLKAAGLYYAVMELKKRYGLDAINVKCQYEFSKEYGMAMCVPLSLAADSGILASCEGDTMLTVSMLMLRYLTGQVITYGDAISHRENIVKLSPCGFIPFSQGYGRKQICNFMPGMGFSGIHNSFVMKPGRVTVMRLVEDIGTYHIMYFTGDGLDTRLRQGFMPALDVRLDGDIGDLVRQYSGQHYAICYGDIGEEIEELAKLLHISTVAI